MSVNFEFRMLGGYVEFECSGTYTLDSTLRLYEQVFEIAARERRGAVLVDVRQLTGTPPTLLERFQHAVHIAKLQSGQKTRIRMAMVGHEPTIHPQRFGEVIARSRGVVGRVFTDLDEAIAWISS